MKVVKYGLRNSPNKLLIVLFIAINFFVAIISSITPLITGKFLDDLLSRPNMRVISQYIIVIISIFVIQMIVSFFIQIVTAYISSETSYRIVKKILNNLFVSSFDGIDTYKQNKITQEVTYDSQVISKFLLEIFSVIPSNVAIIILALVSLFKINLGITSYIVLSFVAYLICLYLLKPIIYQRQFYLKTMQSSFFGLIQEKIMNAKTINIFNAHEFIISKLNLFFKKYKKKLMDFQKISFLFYLGDSLFSTISLLVIFYLGGKLIIYQKITIGDFTILLSYFNMLMNSSKFVSEITTKYTDAESSYNRIQELNSIFQVKSMKQNKIIQLEEILINNLAFRYDNTSEYILKNFSYRFVTGKIYCIRGFNGAGKTTLLELINGMYNNYEGTIAYNDMLLAELNKQDIHERISSYLTQKPVIFSLDLKDNITLGKENILDLTYLISKLNLLSKFNREFLELSGGESQKASILRFFARDVNLYLLDEPTNQLDFVSKKVLIDYLQNIKQRKIIIISTHDPQVLEIADEIIDL